MVHVRDLVTGEHVVYNPLRSHRPVPAGSAGTQWIDDLASKSSEDCDFCNAFTMTASDLFKRCDASSFQICV